MVSLPKQGAQYTLPIEIETGSDDSAIFRLPDSEVAVAPNSVMRIAAPEATEKGLFQRVMQQMGTSLFTVDRQAIEHFQVETPYLVSVVKGTVFNVVVHDDGATVALHEGRLLVTDTEGSHSVDLLPGDVAYSNNLGELQKLNRKGVRYDATPVTPLPAGESGPTRHSEPDRLEVDNKPTPTRYVAGESLHEMEIAAPVSPASNLPEVASLVATVATNDVEKISTVAFDTVSFAMADEIADNLLADNLLDVSVDMGSDTIGAVSDSAGSLTDDLGDVGGDLLGDVEDLTGDLGDLGGVDGDLVDDVGDIAGDLTDELGDVTGDVLGDVADIAGDLTGDLGDVGGDLVGDVGEIAGDLTNDLGDVTSDLPGDVDDIAGDLGDVSGDLVGDVGDITGDLTDDLGDVTGDLLGDVDDIAGDLTGDLGVTGGDILGDVDDLTGDLGDLGDDLLGDVDDLAGDLTDDLGDNTEDLVEDITEDLPDVTIPLLGGGLF